MAAVAWPALGKYAVWFMTILTEMKLLPHSHFGMPGSIPKHALASTNSAEFDAFPLENPTQYSPAAARKGASSLSDLGNFFV